MKPLRQYLGFVDQNREGGLRFEPDGGPADREHATLREINNLDHPEVDRVAISAQLVGQRLQVAAAGVRAHRKVAISAELEARKAARSSLAPHDLNARVHSRDPRIFDLFFKGFLSSGRSPKCRK